MKTWRERISEARERGYFTLEDENLSLMAHTCAVSEAAAFKGEKAWTWFNEHYDGRAVVNIKPYYIGLHALGGLFPCLVKDNNFDGAEECLEIIEDRVMQLKREGK